MDEFVMELTYHVEQHRISEEGRSPENATVHSRFKIWRRGSGEADNRLHGVVVQ